MDVNEELKFLEKFKKKMGEGGGQVGGSGWCRGCERNVGGRGDVGYGRCMGLYNIKKNNKMWGGGAIFEPKTVSMN